MGRLFDARSKKVNAAYVNAIAPSRLEFAITHGSTDDTYFKMYALSDYAAEQPLDWGAGFIGASGLHAPVVISCRPASRAAMQELVDKAASEAEAQIVSVRKSLSETIDDKQAEEHAVRIANMIVRDNVRMYETVIYVALRSRELDAIGDAEDYLRRLLAPYGNGVRTLLANQQQMFFAASPALTNDDVTFEQVARPMPASTLAWMMPFKSTGLLDPRGIPIGKDDANGAVRIDTMTHSAKRKNSNGIIVGDSGSGKSAVLKHLILHEWAVKGAKVLWIDPEGEAEAFVRKLGCTVVKIGSESEASIPIFAPRNIGGADESADVAGADQEAAFAAAAEERVLATTIPYVSSYIKIAFEPEREDMPALEEALEATYARYGITSEMTFGEYDASEISYPVMSDLYEELNHLSDAHPDSPSYKRLAKRIRKAAIGYDSHRYNSRKVIDASDDIVLINTASISADDAMMRAEYFNILSWCWSQIRSERFTGRYVRLVADELHTIVNAKSADAAAMVKNIVQRARKYGAGFIGSTPQIADFRAEKVKDAGESIILNSTYRLYGGARGDNLESIAQIEGFSDKVSQRLLSAQRASFVLCAGLDKTWVETVIPDWELELFGSGGGK